MKTASRTVASERADNVVYSSGCSVKDLSVACIIPTLNRDDFLLRTIQMLLAQTRKPDEIIIVDQTFRESQTSPIHALQFETSISWLTQKTASASEARNRGASWSKSDILLFLDDDIKVATNFVQEHVVRFSDPTVNAVCGQILEGDDQATTTLPPSTLRPQVGWLSFPRNYSKRIETEWMMAGNFSVRRDVFFKVGGMDENYRRGAFREESDFARRFVAAGYRFHFEPNASLYHFGSKTANHGGSRNWAKNPRIAGFHHCIGDWYFTLGHGRGLLLLFLLRFSFRHFVVNRYNVLRPWLLPILCVRWLSALPIALCLRIRGPRLAKSLSENA